MHLFLKQIPALPEFPSKVLLNFSVFSPSLFISFVRAFLKTAARTIVKIGHLTFQRKRKENGVFIKRVGVMNALNILTQNRVIRPGKAGEIMRMYEKSGGEEKVITDFFEKLPQDAVVSAAYRELRG